MPKRATIACFRFDDFLTAIKLDERNERELVFTTFCIPIGGCESVAREDSSSMRDRDRC